MTELWLHTFFSAYGNSSYSLVTTPLRGSFSASDNVGRPRTLNCFGKTFDRPLNAYDIVDIVKAELKLMV